MQQLIVAKEYLPCGWAPALGVERKAGRAEQVAVLRPGASPSAGGSAPWPSATAVTGRYAAVWHRLLVGEL